jgi:hypothetical protein
MRILTNENMAFSMNEVPNEVDDLRYGILDYSNKENVDYHFIPLIFLESFSLPAADLQIGPYRIQMPLDWSLVVGEKELGEIEVLPLKHLNDRDFSAFVMNPISGFMAGYYSVEMVNVYPDIKWYFPKLKHGHILAVPLHDGPNPQCSYFLHDTNKCPEVLDISKMV